MYTVYHSKLIKRLMDLSGEIAVRGEKDKAYARVYKKLSDALDIAVECKLIDYTEEEN